MGQPSTTIQVVYATAHGPLTVSYDASSRESWAVPQGATRVVSITTGGTTVGPHVARKVGRPRVGVTRLAGLRVDLGGFDNG